MKFSQKKIRQVNAWIILAGLLVIGLTYIERPDKITIDVDGVLVTSSIQTNTVAELLKQSKIKVNDATLVYPSLNSKITDGLKISVRYVKPILFVLDGKKSLQNVSSVNVSDALKNVAISPSKDTYVSEKLTKKLPKAGLNKPLVVSTVKPLAIVVGGKEKIVHTNAPTVDALLKEEKIVVDSDDEISSSPDSYTSKGLRIKVVEIDVRLKDKKENMPVETRIKMDNKVSYGIEKIVNAGSPEVLKHTIKLVYADGKLREKTLISTSTVSRGADRVVLRGTGMPPVDPASAKAIAQKLMKSYGWGGEQFECLDSLWTRESGWNYRAENKSSGAYGIPQALPGSKLATAGADWRTNPETQIKWGLGYIKDRYKSPCGAWSHSEKIGWY